VVAVITAMIFLIGPGQRRKTQRADQQQNGCGLALQFHFGSLLFLIF
jgi:hypothetical protein